MTIQTLNHITLACTDLERSFIFYRDVLGFKHLVKWDQGAYFLVGEFWLCLNLDSARQPTSCYTHYAFTLSAQDFVTVSHQIINSGALLFKENISPGESLYFLDPDGHRLEIHVGTWQDRIVAKKKDPGLWRDVEWFVGRLV